MDIREILKLTSYLHGLYEERFPALNAAMARIWYEDLRHLDADLAHQAVRRWVQHYTFKAPNINELLEQAECIRIEQQQARRSGQSDTSPLGVLEDAATAQASNRERSEDDQDFGVLILTLARRQLEPWVDEHGRLRRRITTGEMAQQCDALARQYAEQRPVLAAWLSDAARQYGYLETEQEIHKLPVATMAPEGKGDAACKR